MDWSNNEVIRSQTWGAKRWLSRSANYLSGSNLAANAAELDFELQDTSNALKHDQTTTVKRIHRNNDQLILKRYNARNAWHWLTRSVRSSRAHRCWCMSYHFQRAGLNVAEPLLMLECRAGPLRKNAYLVTRYLPGQELLDALPSMGQAEQEMVRSAIDNAFAAMQAHKITHGDMKASNLMWVDNKLFFVDLDAASKHRSRIRWQRAHTKDRLRFLKNWQQHPELLAMFEAK